MMDQITLKKKEERRILKGHQWVFSNELTEVPQHIQPGELVKLYSHSKRFLGIGFYHPKSLISFRLLSREDIPINADFFKTRIQQALNLRKKIYPESLTNTFRLVHAESDHLPGLIIDKFNDILSVQTFSAGMECWLETLKEILVELFHPRMIVLKNESQLRALEGLELYKKILFGESESAKTIIECYDIKYEIDVLEGQKTGFFLDQRENRRLIERYAKNANVLDVFSNDGGFSLHASKAGAKMVSAIDSSEKTLERYHNNFLLNKLSNFTLLKDDAFEALKKLTGTDQKFDLIILDPPSLTKSKKNIESAIRAYKTLNKLCLRLLSTDGFLASASCSHHVTEDIFLNTIMRAAQETKTGLRLLEKGFQAPDHPVLLTMPETRYLKFAILQRC